MPLPVDNNLLTIGKASSLLGVSPDTLRRLEKKGQASPKRGPNGERLYSADDVSLLKNIIRKPTGERAYSIQETSNILRVSPQTVRRWEREGKIKPERTAGGQRVFTLKDIQTLQNTPKTYPVAPVVAPAPPLPFPEPFKEPAMALPPQFSAQIPDQVDLPEPLPQPSTFVLGTRKKFKTGKIAAYAGLVLLILLLIGTVYEIGKRTFLKSSASNGIVNNYNNINTPPPIPSSNSPQTVISSFKEGSVIFEGTSSVGFAENNGNFFWDNSNAFLGIGTNIPDAALTVSGSAGDNNLLSIHAQDSGNVATVTDNGQTILNLDSKGNLGISGALSDVNDSTLNVEDNLATGGDISVGGGDLTSSKALKVYSSKDITIESPGTIFLKSGSLTNSVKLANTATTLPNGNTGIVDAITDAWNKANSISAPNDEWGSASSVVYPNSTSDNLAIGGTTSAAPFYVAATTGNAKVGDLTVAGGDITLTGVNCSSGYSNGGTLTTDASGNVVCADDDGGTTLAFSGITSATNTVAAMVVGTGASLTYSGSGTINASSLIGGTWAAPGTIGSGTPNSGAFTSLNVSGLTASKVVFTDASKNLTSTGTVGADQGGTGFSSYTVGDLLYADTTTTLAKLNDVATGNVLISGGVSTAPSWGKVTLGTHTTGNYVSQIIGTANQITASAATGDVTLSIPSDFRAPGTVNAVSGIYTGATAGTQRIDATGNLTNIGTASISGTLTIGNGSAIQSAYGPLTLNYKSGDNAWTPSIVMHDVSGDIDFAGGYAGGSGCTLVDSTGVLSCTSITGTIAGSVSFSNITSGTNTQAAMIVDTDASLTYSGSGTINASTLIGSTWAAPGTIGSGTPNSGAFTTLTSSSNSTIGTGAGATNTFGAGASSINTIGSSTTPGALTLHGATTLDNSFTISGNNYASISGVLTVGNGAINQIQSPYGPLALQFKSGDNAWTDSIVMHDVSGDIDFAGGSGSTGCTISNSAGTISCSSGVTASALKWNALTSPDGALTLNMLTNPTTFNWDTGTGASDLFSMTTDASSDGTGYLLNLATGTSSTVRPLHVAAGSVEALAVNASGNVGVGITNPTSKLHVKGVSSVAAVSASDLITADGGFDSATGWTVGSGWTIGSSVVSHSTGLTANLSGTSTATSTTTIYQVKFTVTSVTTAGTGFTVSLGNGTNGVTYSTTGAKSFYVRPTSTSGTIRFTPGSGGTFVGSIDTVQIFAVTPATPELALENSDGSSNNFEFRAGGNGLNNTFAGTNVGQFNIGGTYNTIFGSNSFVYNVSGYENTAFGAYSLNRNFSGVANTAFGLNALNLNVDGGFNTAIGHSSLTSNTSGSDNTAVGEFALYANETGLQNTALGGYTLDSATGSYNIALGYQAADALTTGTNNIVIGYAIDLPALSSSNMLDIGNLIYATGLTSTGTTISTGNVGIGTTSPTAKLDVAGTATVSGILTVGNGTTNTIRSPFGPLNLAYKSGADTWTTGLSIQDTTGSLLPGTDNTQSIGASPSGRWKDIFLGPGSLHLQALTTDSGYGGLGLNLDYALGINTAGTLTTSVNNTVLTAITQGGDVGIGTITPTAKLDVVGNATASGNITMGGQLQLGRFDATPTALGEGTMIFNTSTNTFQCYNGNTWFNCGGTLYSNTNASVADGSYITVTHNLNSNDLLADSWINSQSTWKLLDATYQPAIAWEGKDTEKGVYHNNVNSYVPTQITTITTASLADGLLYDTFEDTNKTDSANTTASLTSQKPDDGATNYTTLQDRIQGGRTGLIGGQTYNTATNDNDGQAYLGSNTVNDTFYYDRSKDSSPEVLVELGIDPNWYNGVTLSVATTSAQFSQNSTIPNDRNPNLSTSYNGSLIRATGTDSSPMTIYITIKSPTTFDWTNYNGDAATGVTMTPGTAQTLGATGVSVTFTNTNYNTGDTFKIASWFIEAEGTTRGAKQAFPERNYVVSNSTNVDIIDADTQKLWMRLSGNGTNNQSFVTYSTSVVNSATMLNGVLYSASATDLRVTHFNTDSGNAINAANGTFLFNQPIAGRGVTTMAANLISTSPTIVAAVVNDVAAAVIPNAPTQEVTVNGWGYIAGDNVSTNLTETVNLPYKFNSIPTVSISIAGANNGAVPTGRGDCTSGGGFGGSQSSSSANGVTTSSFTAQLTKDTTAFSSGAYFCYTWTATGTVSPKQFVAVAEGNSTNGGASDVINETDGTVAHIMSANGVVNTLNYQTKAVISGNSLYLADGYIPTSLTTINVYYGIHGLTTESTVAYSRRCYIGVGFIGTCYPTILGTATGLGQTTSLAATPGTSTIDNGVSNTLYVGTTSGATVLQEKQGLGTVNSGAADGTEENSGSVKYYTKDYISEEMVGDIRGMWPLNNANSSSDFEDVSIKAETLTGTNITANGDSVSGVRNTATDFNGTDEYMSCTDANCGGTTELDMGTSDFTLGAWVKTSSATNQEVIRKGSGGGGTAFYQLRVNSSGGVTAGYSDGAAGGNTTTSNQLNVANGQWHYIVATMDRDSAVSIYIDGQLDKTLSVSGTASMNTADDFYIGFDGGSVRFTGSIDEPFITATALSAGQVKHMYEVGYRALQSHGTGLGGGAADTNQQLGFISTGTSVVGDAQPDYNNQFMYVGTNSTTLGAVSKIQLDSDTNIKTYNSSANVPSGGPLLIDEDTSSLAVGNTLEAVGSAASGVKSMGVDNNATATSGNFVSKTFTLPKNIASAVLWVSPIIDASDGSNTLTVKASNDGGSNYATCTLVGTDSSRAVPEKEYACTFTASNNSLKVKFEFARGSTKTNTYVTQYGITWLGQTGFRIEQADANNVRLYNYSGETQNLKLNVTGAAIASANSWTDGGGYLYPTGYEQIRVYDGTGTNYLSLHHDGTYGSFDINGTDVLNIDVTGNILPETNDTQNLGSDTLRWQDIYTGPGTIHIGTSTTDEYTLSYNTTNNYLGFNVNGSGNPEIVFDSTGSVGIGTTAPQFKLDVAGTASISGTLSLGPMVQGLAGTCDVSSAGKQYYDGPENKFYYCNGTAWTAMGSGSSNWTLNTTDGTLYPNNFATVDVLIGGSATSSAKFAFKNMLTGTGTPSFIPGTDNAYDLGASPSSRFRNLFLGPESLHIQAKTTDSGYSGLGVNLDYALGINTSGRFTTSANGTSLTALDPYSGNFAALGVGQFGGLTPSTYSRFGTASTDHSLSATSDLLIQGNIELDGVLYLDGRTIASSNGTSTITFPTDPTAVNSFNILTNGSWLVENPLAGNPGIAALMVNQTKDADIFTASASGISKFTIDRLGDATASGNITMGGQLQLGRFASQPTAVGPGVMIFNTTTNTEQCYNGSTWYNCGGTLYSNTNASVADGSYITVTHNLNSNDLLADSWINSQSTWKLLDATYQPAIAWEGKDTEKGVYHNNVNSYVPTQITTITTASLADGLLYDTFEDSNKTDSANTTASLTSQKPDDGATNYTTLQDRIQGGRTGLMGGQTYNTATNDNDGQAYLGSNTVNDTFYYDRSKDSSPEVLVELGIDPNWYNGVTLSVATTSAQFSQNSTVPNDKNPNLTTSYNGSLIRATGTDSDPKTIYITIKSPTTFDWTNYNGDGATGVTMTPGTAQTLGATGVSVTFSAVNYNTGDTFKIASWFIEAEGTTRGAKQQFPERSYIVMEGVSGVGNVDIIDADSQKLWMRFNTGSGFMIHSNPAGLDFEHPISGSALNGKIYVGKEDGSAGGLDVPDFIHDTSYNYDYDPGGTYLKVYKGNVAQRNAGTGFKTLSSTIGLLAQTVNDVSAAVIPNAPTQEVTVSGWGYQVGNDTTDMSEVVNLPYKFNSVPNVTVASAGWVNNTAPTSLSSCSTSTLGGISLEARAYTITASQFNLRQNVSTGFSSSWSYCYTWTATGTVSPKQFVAVATGASGADGGNTVINETDGTSANFIIGSQTAGNQWQTEIELTEDGTVYSAYNSDATNLSYVLVYYNIPTLITEASWANYFGGFYAVNSQGIWSANGPTILGSSGTSQINSLKVMGGTSTIDGKSNTIYVGTAGGLSVIQENQGHGNVGQGSGSAEDGKVEYSGSVKYYTKDYISEEMVGDIRGMWPLNNANSSSDFEDVSIKAETLTGTNITANGDSVSGVRGTATDFDGSTEYMSCTDVNCGGTTELDFPGTGSWTVGGWVKTTSSSAQSIITKDNDSLGTGRSWALYVGVAAAGVPRYTIFKTDGSYNTLDANSAINDGNWHQVIGTYTYVGDGTSTLAIYVDGKLENSISNAVGPIQNGGAAVRIGAREIAATPNYLAGSLDEIFVTATNLSSGQIKYMYEVGSRALQSHGTTLGGGSADTNQQLGYISTGTNSVGAAQPDYNNQFMYVGTNSTTLGAVSKIQLNSDTNIKTYNSSANVPAGGPLLIDEDTKALAVGNTLEAVGSAASGVKSMGIDNNATATSGDFVSKTFTLPKNIASTVLWVSPVLDSSDGSNTLTVKASNDGGSNYATCTLVGTDSSKTVPEKEYACTFTASNNSLKVKFEFARGSTKTNTYVTQYGITWLGQTGFRIEQADANSVRLYNYSGETQNLKLNVTGASTAALANPWTDGGAYLYPTGYETIRAYNGAGTHYLELGNDGSNGTLAYDGTTYVKISSAGSLLPGTDNTQSIGATASARWKDIFLGPGSLHLQANTADSGYSGLGTNLDYAMSINTAGTLNTSVNGTNVMSITQGGNVGINIATPSAKLDIVTAITGDIQSAIRLRNPHNVEGGTGVGIQFGTVENATERWKGLIAFLMTNTSGRGDLIFATNNAADGTSASISNERMRITAAGNVGIGTTSPATTLDIDPASNTQALRLRGLAETTEIADFYVGSSGELIISTTAGADGAQYIDLRPEDNELGLILREGTGASTAEYANFYLNNAATDYLNINVNATNATAGLVLQSGGYVGIGVTNPASPLVIFKSPDDSDQIRLSSSTGTTSEYMYFKANATSDYGLLGYWTGSSSGNIHIPGHLNPYSTNGYDLGTSSLHWGCLYYNNSSLGSCASDERLKTNIQPLDFGDALAKISGLKIRSFIYNNDPNQAEMHGLVAQEVLPFAPELVTVGSDGYYKLNYGDIQWLTLQGIQEQQQEIDLLAEQIGNVTLTDAGDLNITQTETGDYQLTDTSTNSIIDRVGAFGQLLAANIKAGAIVTQKLVSQNLESGYAKIETLIAQQATILNVNTKLISPVPGDDLAVELPQDSRFKIQDSNQTEVASIDSEGNATFAGEVHSQNIDDIQALLNQVQTDQSVLFAATSSSDLTASTSANLASLITSDLYVTNQAAVNSLSVSSSVTIGGDLVISSVANPLENGTWQIENTLDTLSYPLRIQSLAMAPVEIMAGLVTIDTSGNVMISGNLAVKGEITTQKLTIKSDVENGPVVASIDASGSAVFSDIQTGKITGSDKERGSIDILPAEDTKLIEKIWESTPAAVFVSPSYNTQAWVENTSLNGFTIRVSTSPESEVQKLYWWALW